MVVKQPILVFKGKYWQFQLIGFSILIIQNLLIIWGNHTFTLKTFYDFIVSYGSLFLIVTLMRPFYRKFYGAKKNPLYIILYIIVGSIIGGFLWTEMVSFGRMIINNSVQDWSFKGTQYNLIASILSSAWAPFIWSILYFGIKYWQEMITERERAQKAIFMAQQAQLQMLRYQLNPHFLFNSLNSVQALIHENPDQADDMIAELSEFLRLTLRYNNRVNISVTEEIEITKKYLLIEKIRYEERLNYSINVDEDALGVEIPCFITQPLVENSIKHGLYENPKGIDLQFNIRLQSRMLTIEVANTGRLPLNWRMGVGFKNVKERLESSYPNRFKFLLDDNGAMVVARIQISLQNEKIHNPNS